MRTILFSLSIFCTITVFAADAVPHCDFGGERFADDASQTGNTDDEFGHSETKEKQ